MLWLNALHREQSNGQACVLVTISEVQGSAPRRVGARMLIARESISDTIGGGVLEKQAIEQARSMLQAGGGEPIITSQKMILGSDLDQCCGGAVTLCFEYHPACALNVVVFGAGHVAQCVAKLLIDIPSRIQVFDSRTDWLEKLPKQTDALGAISAKKLSNNVFQAVEHCPDNAFYLVMTHSHEIDLDIVEAVLSRGDSVYCGLIASKSKAAKFKSVLSRKGFTADELDKLTAPIGVKKIGNNVPMEVAIAAVSQMLTIRDERQAALNSVTDTVQT